MSAPPAARIAAGLSFIALLAGCTVGPDYVRPPAPVPAKYKEAEGWKSAAPQPAASGEAWWSVFQDPVLDGLERQVEVSNQNLKSAEAAYRTAQAIVGEARAGYFPTLDAGAAALREGSGAGSASSSRSFGNRASVQNAFSASVSATWVPDIWGSIRRTVESDVANAQASAADLAAAQLSAQAALATDYIQLRIADATKRLLDATVEAFTRSLQITKNRYGVGTAARTDVASATAQLESTRAQAIAITLQRAQFEHAIAVLVGQPPGDFAIAPAAADIPIPEIPLDLPSTLLERNPSIAASERAMAAANARIGVAIAGYFPSITLGASYGQQSSMLHTLFTAASSLWSFGVTNINLPIFTGGLTQAQVAAARATYDQTVATYRQTVLTAFQQVEDQLAASRILAQQAEAQGRAVDAALEAERLTLNQYRAGTVDYTAVITAQANSLADRETALGLLQSRLVAGVALIEALGGGWDARALGGAAQAERPSAPPAQSHAAVGSK
ncbi:MAG TPA: efflux transporter outer membrane subunit [Stellaceae bacterium]|jgi:NodT family efflux transporter outer membrane factor (OMF) lipoprotein|nr:efflux transporter outer membrane subunit [Stellaceae bacterium]